MYVRYPLKWQAKEWKASWFEYSAMKIIQNTINVLKNKYAMSIPNEVQIYLESVFVEEQTYSVSEVTKLVSFVLLDDPLLTTVI
jgi:hypothetical protein